MSIPTWEEAAESEFWEKLPHDLHEQAVRDYLGSNGDAIDARVQKLIGLADALYRSRHHGPSIVVSVIALEVMIHYFSGYEVDSRCGKILISRCGVSPTDRGRSSSSGWTYHSHSLDRVTFSVFNDSAPLDLKLRWPQ